MKYRSSIRNRTLETEPHSSNRVCHNSRSRVPLRALQAVQIFTSVTTGCIRNTSIKRRDEKVLYIFGWKVGIVKEEKDFSLSGKKWWENSSRLLDKGSSTTQGGYMYDVHSRRRLACRGTHSVGKCRMLCGDLNCWCFGRLRKHLTRRGFLGIPALF